MTQTTPQPEPQGRRSIVPHWVVGYAWLAIKNILGWVLILVSGPIGMAMPGPGGIPLFLIGFALISFPGKRALTSRMLRGRAVPAGSRSYEWGITLLAILLPAAVMGYLAYLGYMNIRGSATRNLVMTGVYLVSGVGLWFIGHRARPLVNRFLALMARARHRFRPWLRAKGIDLLPRRRRRRHVGHDGRVVATATEEIVEFHENYGHWIRYAFAVAKPWLFWLLRIAFIVAIFIWMFRPIYRNWDDVKARLATTNPWHFAAAALMFSAFLAVIRATSWRWILRGMGHRLRIRPAQRIWSMSELARYVPGVIWQVVGRVYLVRPYGVSGSICSTSQLLELVIFMLANVIVAIACLAVAGFNHFPPGDRQYFIGAMAVAPLLLILLHPKIFYGLMNRLLRKLRKPAITKKLKERDLLTLLAWALIGLIWQSFAVWLVTSSTLALPLRQWWILAGAYCLAWTAGFSIGFMTPGGMGPREYVFATTLMVILPADTIAALNLPNEKALFGFLVAIAILLRLWVIAGELTLAGLAYLADYRGAIGDPNAPGRVPLAEQMKQEEPAVADDKTTQVSPPSARTPS